MFKAAFQMNTKIPYLSKGDTIYITAPAKAIEAEHVDFAKNFLEKNGFNVIISEHCLGQENYFSGTDNERRSDFQKGLDDPSVKAILCARGGYGSVRIVDDLQWAGFLRQPKWIIGFSDITYFHHKIHNFELQSIHGSMPLNFSNNTHEALTTIIQALKGETIKIEISSSDFNKLGEIEGELIGGNLSIIYALLGTNDLVDYTGKILFIEDLAENLYAIDRMMYALSKSGILDKIKGLIIGGMTDLKDTAVPFGQTYQELILEKFKFRKIPICFDFPAGHINDNRALIFGKEVKLVINKDKTTLEY